MFEKMSLKHKIKKCKKEILRIEGLRARSQAALVTSILNHSTPSDEDADYFNKFTAQIEVVRNQMHEYELLLKQQQ